MAPAEEEEDEESSGEGGDEKELSRREFAILLARDVLIAVILVAVVIGLVFAYAQVWPPMVVVESGSMQHSGPESFLGVIDTGDLVLVQAVRSPADVVTYVEGRASGYQTYSNYGDVIVFHPPGTPPATTPIIHRAMVYVDYPSASGPGVDIPSLASFPASEWSGLNWTNVAATTPTNLRSVTIQVQSWHLGVPASVSLTFDFAPRIGTGTMIAGFLTKGDHNPSLDTSYDGVGRPPVPVSEIVGRARGELPWFGLLKLTISPTPRGCCRGGWGDSSAPKNSWDSLAASLILIPVGIFLADYGFAFAERRWKAHKEKKTSESPPSEVGPPPEEPASDSEDEPR